MRNKLFIKTICGLLLLALLMFNVGKATTVYAFADPVQAIAPIYDTQIIQLQDYIDNGGLTSGQLDIFYTLAGFYVLGQAGSSGYRLVDPYANTDSVWDWLKSCGIEIYNSVIGLIPDTAQMPITGNIYSTIPFKKASQLYVATLMGAAVKAATFSSYQDFKDEVINSQSYYLPWNLDVQKGMNSIFGIYGGVYEWQFDNSPWTSDFFWNAYNLTEVAYNLYQTSVETHDGVPCRMNYSNNSSYKNCSLLLPRKYNLFINTTDQKACLTDDAGNVINTYQSWNSMIYASSASNIGSTILQYTYIYPKNLSNYTGDTYLEIVRNIFNSYNDRNKALIYVEENRTYSYVNYADVIEHVYVGSNWLDKHELFNLKDLNFGDTDQNYYDAVSEDNDYLLDIKGILQDILNNTDLFNIFIDNLVDINGVPVHDDDLIRITTYIYDLLEQTNPVLPVNLNDVSEYTDNTYLDVVKERATAAGSTLANLVAFWHNCDAELIYAIFGAGIMVLVGAFIGKWGHS